MRHMIVSLPLTATALPDSDDIQSDILEPTKPPSRTIFVSNKMVHCLSQPGAVYSQTLVTQTLPKVSDVVEVQQSNHFRFSKSPESSSSKVSAVHKAPEELKRSCTAPELQTVEQAKS